MNRVRIDSTEMRFFCLGFRKYYFAVRGKRGTWNQNSNCYFKNHIHDVKNKYVIANNVFQIYYFGYLYENITDDVYDHIYD